MTGWLARLRSLVTPAEPFPFTLDAVDAPDPQVEALFRRSFGAPAPTYPLHYVARRKDDASVRGYVHYTQQEPGVYLCGGLCVDARGYRGMSAAQRAAVRGAGSLSSWLLKESIAALPSKRAVFAYTGNVVSRRDGLGAGFEPTSHRFLLVQWHAAAATEREAMLARIAALGPF